MFFIFKKIIGPVFFPLSLCMFLLVFGLFFLFFTKKQRTGKIISALGVLLLILFSYGVVTNPLLRGLERKYSNFESISDEQIENIKWIVILGGGINSDPEVSLTSQLNSSTLARVVEGIRAYKRIDEAKLLVCGGKVWDDVSEGSLMRKMAIELGVKECDVYVEGNSKDTKDQAWQVKKIIGNEPFCLVTSAYHMNRALMLFKKQDMDPLAVPTDYLIRYSKKISPGEFFPSSRKIWKAEKLIKEYLGILWAKLRNQI